MSCDNSSWINFCTNPLIHYNLNCIIEGNSLPNPIGCFNFGCDGVERLIYTITLPKPNLQFNIKNTGDCPFKISLTQLTNGVTTTINFDVDPGQPLSISSNNITNIHITCKNSGLFKYCNYCNSCCANTTKTRNIGCKGCAGNYTILT